MLVSFDFMKQKLQTYFICSSLIAISLMVNEHTAKKKKGHSCEHPGIFPYLINLTESYLPLCKMFCSLLEVYHPQKFAFLLTHYILYRLHLPGNGSGKMSRVKVQWAILQVDSFPLVIQLAHSACLILRVSQDIIVHHVDELTSTTITVSTIVTLSVLSSLPSILYSLHKYTIISVSCLSDKDSSQTVTGVKMPDDHVVQFTGSSNKHLDATLQWHYVMLLTHLKNDPINLCKTVT